MKKLTHEEYLSRLEESNSEFFPLENYIDSRTSILHKHLICGSTFTSRPSRILTGTGCRKCNNKKLSHDDYLEKLFKKFGGSEALKNVQKRDYAKQMFCTQNKIPLLIFPYWEVQDSEDSFDIKKINRLIIGFVETQLKQYKK